MVEKLTVVFGWRRRKLNYSYLYFGLIGIFLALTFIVILPVNVGSGYDLHLRSVSEIDSNFVNNMVSKSKKFSVEETMNMSIVYPFKADPWFGYINQEGEITYREKFDYKVEMSHRYFINYSLFNSSLRIKNQEGHIVSIIDSKGYPLLREHADVLYVLKNYGSNLSSFAFSGESLWSRQFLMPISCFSARGSHALIGISNGSIFLVEKSGITVSSFFSDSSRLPVTIGCSLNPSNLVVAIMGIEPQYLYVLDMSDGLSPTVLHEIVLGSSFRREVPIGITTDNRYVFYPTETQLMGLDLETGKVKSIIDLKVEDMFLNGNIVFFLGRNDKYRLLVWATTDGKVLGSLDLQDQITINVSDNNIFMGLDTKLLSINIGNR